MRRKGFKYEKNKPIPCPKCGYETSQTKDLSMSTRTHKFGRQNQSGAYDVSDDENGVYSDYGNENIDYGSYAADGDYDDDGEDDDEDEEDSSSDDEPEEKDEAVKDEKCAPGSSRAELQS